jgi:hypothetical protein
MQITLGEVILAVIVVAAIVLSRRRRGSTPSLSLGPADEGTVVAGSTTEGWSPARERGRRPWVRIGLISAVLWVVVGLVLAFLWKQAGHPRDSAIVALGTGPFALLIVGRLDKLQGRGNWLRAGALAVGVAMLVGWVALIFWVMVACG